jgi:hypothetical protein
VGFFICRVALFHLRVSESGYLLFAAGRSRDLVVLLLIPLRPPYIFTASTARTLPLLLHFMGSLQKIKFFSITVTRRLMMGIRTEKRVVRQFRHRANVIECRYTNLDSIAYCS